MKINRVWAMPNGWTFKIKPIAELLRQYLGEGKGWIDPCSGTSTLTEFTNDFDKNTPAKSHMEAIEYLQQFEQNSMNGMLIDPPYTWRQTRELYHEAHKKGIEFHLPATKLNDYASKLVKLNGLVISFGWNTNGVGLKRGFQIIEILLIAHGGHHNDTIVTVERKIRE